MKLDSFGIFSKNTQISDILKMCPVRADYFHVDGRTVMTKLIFTFRSSANAHTKGMDTATDGLHLPATAAPV